MLKDTNSLDGAHMILSESFVPWSDQRSIYRSAADITTDILIEMI